MNSKELYEKYLEAMKQRMELEAKIESYIEKWQKGETVLSTKLVEEIVEKGQERLENLKQIEQNLHQELLHQEKKEAEKKSADVSLRSYLGTALSNINIVGGVLSSNPKESHLIGEEKTLEQLEQEKNQMLSTIKQKVKQGELTLEEASKLVNDVNTSFEFYNDNGKGFSGK